MFYIENYLYFLKNYCQIPFKLNKYSNNQLIKHSATGVNFLCQIQKNNVYILLVL